MTMLGKIKNNLFKINKIRYLPLKIQSSWFHFETASNDIFRFLENSNEISKNDFIYEKYNPNDLRVQVGISKITLSELDEICFKDILIQNNDDLIENDNYYELETVKSTNFLIAPFDIKNILINNEFLENVNNLNDLENLPVENKKIYLTSKCYYLIEGQLTENTINNIVNKINDFKYIE